MKTYEKADKSTPDKQKQAAEPLKTATKAVTDALNALRDPVGMKEQELEAARRLPAPNAAAVTTAETALAAALNAVVISDGSPLKAADFTGGNAQSGSTGLYALQKVDLFNLLCIPPHGPDTAIEPELVDAAAQFCETRRAFLIVDPLPGWSDKDTARNNMAAIGSRSKNAAVFFPTCAGPTRSPATSWLISRRRGPWRASSPAPTPNAACGRPRPGSRRPSAVCASCRSS